MHLASIVRFTVPCATGVAIALVIAMHTTSSTNDEVLRHAQPVTVGPTKVPIKSIAELGGFFERLPGGRIRVYYEKGHFEHRAVPLLARVGAVRVDDLFVAPDGRGFSGTLAREPNPGDRLFVRYADETEFATDLSY